MSALARNEAMTWTGEDQRRFQDYDRKARKIKIFLCRVYFWEEVASKWSRAVESSAYYVREKVETDAALSYLFLSLILLSAFVHLENTDIPVRKHRSFLTRQTVLFSSPSWQTREFRYGSSRKEHNAHCALSKYQKICATVSYIKTDVESFQLRLSSLNVS